MAEFSDSSESSFSAREGWFTKPQDSSSSGGIAFEDSVGSESSSSDQEDSSKGDDTVDAPNSSTPSLQSMYIQMEYCEKSTLRTAIDSELFRDKTRIWRLFREIVEGLAYIHQQGIIHRDLKVIIFINSKVLEKKTNLPTLWVFLCHNLKPVNIFLDSEDHVKIGDFGLATSSPLTNLVGAVTIDVIDGTPQAMLPSEKSSEVVSSSGQFTGQIGTALYVAPELKAASE